MRADICMLQQTMQQKKVYKELQSFRCASRLDKTCHVQKQHGAETCLDQCDASRAGHAQ